MIQPNLDHLNPCFDELMETFDFLFCKYFFITIFLSVVNVSEIVIDRFYFRVF